MIFTPVPTGKERIAFMSNIFDNIETINQYAFYVDTIEGPKHIGHLDDNTGDSYLFRIGNSINTVNDPIATQISNDDANLYYRTITGGKRKRTNRNRSSRRKPKTHKRIYYKK